MVAQKKQLRTLPVVSRREVEAWIADGRTILIWDGYVLKVDAWLKYHPGGDKAIMHMVGRDATDEINALHSLEARQTMNRYRVGKIQGRWKNFVPPIQGGRFRQRRREDEDEDECSEEEHLVKPAASASSSDGCSRSPSPPPVFDSTDGASGPRIRHAGKASSVSSISSVGEDDQPFDGMAHLDALTKKEIKLDLAKYPALDPDTQDAIVQKYRLLFERVEAEGLFDCTYWFYIIEGCRFAALFGLMLLFLRWRWYTLSATCLGVFWHQLVFTAHDAGHMGITHHYHIDTLIGIVIADFLGGLSMGWWKRNHNVHHIVTNSPEHDPDIEHMPFFAISHRLLGSLTSTYYDRIMEYDAAAKFLVSVQHRLYFIVLLFGRFNLYRLSWEYLILGLGPKKGPAWWHRWVEIAGQVFFWAWFGYGILYKSIDSNWGRCVFVMVSHMATAPLHGQITLSHFAMSTADLGVQESFPQRMLRTTMDVDCPRWLDFFHGGLQFQAIHHLYPRMPRHNLRKAQRLVQEFCNDVGIPYALYGFVDGNKQVVGKLGDVARQAAILAKCQAALAKGHA